MTPKEKNLCIAIAKCKNQGVNPCDKIASVQCNCTFRQLPEPWNGHLSQASIMFIGSNPSIDFDEKFPNVGWLDCYIQDFFDNRFEHGKIKISTGKTVDVGYWTKIFEYTCWILYAMKNNSPNAQSLFINSLNGNTYSTQLLQAIISNSNFSPTPQDLNTQTKNAIKNKKKIYSDLQKIIVSTEIVHCKSMAEYGVSKCNNTCFDKWMKDILTVFCKNKGKLIVLLGKEAQKYQQKILSFKPNMPIIALDHPNARLENIQRISKIQTAVQNLQKPTTNTHNAKKNSKTTPKATAAKIP